MYIYSYVCWHDGASQPVGSTKVSLATRKADIRLPGKGIQTPIAQGRSTQIIPMAKWVRTGRLSMNNSLSLPREQMPKEAGDSVMLGYRGFWVWGTGRRVQQGWFSPNLEGNVTTCAPHQALKSLA